MADRNWPACWEDQVAFHVTQWVTDFNTPPVLRGAALLAVQRQRCIKFRVLRAQDVYALLALNGKKGSTSQLEGYENQSPTESHP